MKILYLMTEPFGVGGVQSDMLAMAEELTPRGHTVYVATTPGVLLDELKAKGARHVPIDFGYTTLRGMWQSVRALRRFVASEGIDVVAPQSGRSTMAAAAALKFLPFAPKVAGTGRRPPIVTTIHNIHNPRYFSFGGHVLQRCADYVIFESHYERDRMLASGLSTAKSEVIHSGIDTERFVPRERDLALAAQWGIDPTRHRVLGIVARLSEEKGHHYLVDAFARVSQEQPEARLMIVGDGPLLQTVKDQVAAAGLHERVIFTGLQREIPRYLSLFDVFVLSSTRESFPLAAREAMAGGKAVILPRIGGCPEVVDEGKTGYLFESANVESLAQAMREILQGERCREFGRAARERVERLFSRRSWVEGDERVYLDWARRPG
jgi:L-malate glycosyltransferase